MGNRWSASQMPRIMNCLGSASLPQVHEEGPAAERGTEIHAEVLDGERCPDVIWQWLVDGFSSAQTRPVETQLQQDVTDFMGFEVTFAWSPETFAGRLLGQNMNRDYSTAREDEITGTADAVAWWLSPNGWHIRIGDLKTGPAQIRGGLPPAGESWQLRTLALAVARQLPVFNVINPHPSDARFKIASCKVAHFLYADGAITIDEATFSFSDLCTFRDQIARKWMDNIHEPGQSYHRGPHCNYCPSFDFCPAQQSSVRALALIPPPYRDGNHKTIKTAVIPDTWSDLKAAERICEQAKKTLLATVERHGGSVPSRPGYELTTMTRKMRRIDGAKAGDVLAKTLDARSRDAFVRPVVTQESIADGLKTLGLDGFSVENIMSILADNGAVTVEESAPFLTERRIRIKESK